MRAVLAGLVLALLAGHSLAKPAPCPEGVVCFDVPMPRRPDRTVDEVCRRLADAFARAGMNEQDCESFRAFCRSALGQSEDEK